jgi:hypothetical protein
MGAPGKERALEEERCPGCKGLIIDGVCPFCTSPIPGLRPVEPDPPRAPTVAPGSPAVSVAANVLVLVLGVAWLVISVLQFGVSLGNRPGAAPFLLFVAAVLSLIVGVYTVYVAWAMLRRTYRIQGQLMLVAAVGVLWGTIDALLFEDWFLLVFVPVHLMVGVFAFAGSRYLGGERS